MQVVSENFNLTINHEINDILEADMLNLNIKNKNTLINLIVYYYITYEIQETEEKIKKEIKTKLKSIKSTEEIDDIFEIIKKMAYPNLKVKKDCAKLNFRLNIEAFTQYESYIQEMDEKKFNISRFFREILEWYCKKKQYEREIILYKKIIEKIKAQLPDKNSNRKVLRIKIKTLGNKEVQVIPLGMVVSKNEDHVYLLGYSKLINHNNTFEENKKFKIFPTRISNIKEIKSGRTYEFVKEDIQNEDLSKIPYSVIEEAEERMKKRFTSSGKADEVKISLTKLGKAKLEMAIFNRPFRLNEVKCEEDLENERYIYTFENTNFAVKAYFLSFGKECEILAPQNLREEFKNFYMEAYEKYKGE